MSSGVVLIVFFFVTFQFSGENAEKMKSAYGEFCSNHMDGVELYKVNYLLCFLRELFEVGFVC